MVVAASTTVPASRTSCSRVAGAGASTGTARGPGNRMILRGGWVGLDGVARGLGPSNGRSGRTCDSSPGRARCVPAASNRPDRLTLTLTLALALALTLAHPAGASDRRPSAPALGLHKVSPAAAGRPRCAALRLSRLARRCLLLLVLLLRRHAVGCAGVAAVCLHGCGCRCGCAGKEAKGRHGAVRCGAVRSVSECALRYAIRVEQSRQVGPGSSASASASSLTPRFQAAPPLPPRPPSHLASTPRVDWWWWFLSVPRAPCSRALARSLARSRCLSVLWHGRRRCATCASGPGRGEADRAGQGRDVPVLRCAGDRAVCCCRA